MGTPSEGAAPDGLRTILQARTEFEARAAAVALEDAGIRSVVQVPAIETAFFGAGVSGPFGNVLLQVRAADAQRARAALDAARAEGASVDWGSIDVGPDDAEVHAAARGAPGSAAMRPLARTGLWCAIALVVLSAVAMVASLVRSLLERGVVPALAVALLSGCGYTLQGKVVEGGFDAVDVLPRSQADAAGGAPVQSASVELYRDPSNPKRKLVGAARTDENGEFRMVLQDFGAGWMEERWLVRIRRAGYKGVEQTVELPMSPDKWTVLGTMSRGRAVPFTEAESGDALRRQADSFSGPGAFPR